MFLLFLTFVTSSGLVIFSVKHKARRLIRQEGLCRGILNWLKLGLILLSCIIYLTNSENLEQGRSSGNTANDRLTQELPSP